jgi:hypothetical protein
MLFSDKSRAKLAGRYCMRFSADVDLMSGIHSFKDGLNYILFVLLINLGVYSSHLRR